MSKSIEQLTDKHNHLVEFIWPCYYGQTLVRWFVDPITVKTQQLLPKRSANWVKSGLLKNGYHIT